MSCAWFRTYFPQKRYTSSNFFGVKVGVDSWSWELCMSSVFAEFVERRQVCVAALQSCFVLKLTLVWHDDYDDDDYDYMASVLCGALQVECNIFIPLLKKRIGEALKTKFTWCIWELSKLWILSFVYIRIFLPETCFQPKWWQSGSGGRFETLKGD